MKSADSVSGLWSYALRSFSFVWPYRAFMLAALFCVILRSGLNLVVPWTLRTIVDVALPDRDIQLLIAMIALILVVPILENATSIAQEQFGQRASGRAQIDIRQRLFHRLHALSLRFPSNTSTGDILSRFDNDLTQFQLFAHSFLLTLIAQSLTFLFTVAILLRLSPSLTIAALCLVPPFGLLHYLTRRRNYEVGRDMSEQRSSLTKVIQEQVSHIRMIRIHLQELYELSNLAEGARKLARVQIRGQILQNLTSASMTVLTGMGTVAVFGYGGYQVLVEKLSPGALIAFYAYLRNVYNPVSQLTEVCMRLARVAVPLKRILEWIDYPVDLPEPANPVIVESCRGAVECRSVFFAYEPSKPVIKGISFTVEPKQTVALVGKSGVGKTTLAYLIARLYDPDSGQILLDGHDLRSYRRDDLMRHIGIITQDIVVFHQSFRDNLRLSVPDATDASIEQACCAAHLHDMITSLPDGYDTIVGERGQRLSEGERQRLSIARIFLRKPAVLILDEITSSQDAITEAALQDALTNIMRDCTKIIIAHRLSTVMSADRILVLNDGQIVDYGTHGELMQKSSIYRNLYQRQFASSTN